MPFFMIYYRLQFGYLSTEQDAQLAELLDLTVNDSQVEIELDDLESHNYDFTLYFKQLLHDKWEALTKLGLSAAEMTVWVLYEYDQQCNLEFSAEQLSRIQEFSRGLCISCWQKDSIIIL